MTRKYGVLAAAACVIATLGVAGCGGDSKDDSKDAKDTKREASQEPKNELANLTAQQISDKAKNALLGASSLRMKMQQGTAADAMQMDMALDNKGNCQGTIGVGQGASSEVIKSGDKVWMKPNERFWSQPEIGGGKDGAAAAELFKGRYIYGTTNDDMLKDNADMCDLAAMQATIKSSSSSKDKLTKGEPTKLGSQLVVPLSGPGDAPGEKETMYIAATGTPYPLKIVTEGGSGSGTVELSDYGKPVTPTPPPASETIDVAKIEKQFGKQ